MEMNEPLGSLLSPSFNNQEMAARVYSRSKTSGDEVLRRLAKGRVTMSELREILNRTETLCGLARTAAHFVESRR